MNSEQAQPEGALQEKGAGDSKSASPANTRHSPVTPLAPLEFLQNQRRGSITDPSLHAAGAGAGLNHSLGGARTGPRRRRHCANSHQQRPRQDRRTRLRLLVGISPQYRRGRTSYLVAT